MKRLIKENGVLVLAFALPVLFILGIAIATYVPSVLLDTKYNFVYATCGGTNNYYPYDCVNYYNSYFSVENGKLIVNPIDPKEDRNGNNIKDAEENYNFRVFLHDTEKNISREISLEEAKLLTLDPLLTSADGVSVSSGYHNRGSDFFFFFDSGSSQYAHYLTKGNHRQKLNLIDVYQDYYQRNIKFLGWVLPGRN